MYAQKEEMRKQIKELMDKADRLYKQIQTGKQHQN